MNTAASATIPTAPPDTNPRVYIQPGFRWDEQGAYLFDIDGTLLRSRDRVHYDSFFSSVQSVLGHKLTLDGVTLHGNTDPGILRDAFRLSKLEDARWQPLLADMLEHMRASVLEKRDQMNLIRMPGVEETLAYLHSKGAALGVATGNLEAIGWIKVEAVGLRHWFTFGGFSDIYDIRAEMIGNAIKEAHRIAGPQATVCVVGDTEFDVKAARANSLPTIAIATGNYSFDELMKTAPEVCATSLQALLEHTAQTQTHES